MVSKPWGWEVTIHIYYKGPYPPSLIEEASKAAAAVLNANDFVGAEIKQIEEAPLESGLR